MFGDDPNTFFDAAQGVGGKQSVSGFYGMRIFGCVRSAHVSPITALVSCQQVACVDSGAVKQREYAGGCYNLPKRE